MPRVLNIFRHCGACRRFEQGAQSGPTFVGFVKGWESA
jgi:hypothetical protein